MRAKERASRKHYPPELKRSLVKMALAAINEGRSVAAIAREYGVNDNLLFKWMRHGGERGALLYGVIGTCRLNGIDPERYLKQVLSVIADWPINRVSELLPWRITLPAE